MMKSINMKVVECQNFYQGDIFYFNKDIISNTIKERNKSCSR